ncbi:MAG: hypothetical protein IKE43_00865 [Coriobacteriales bacterium]|nr:hypothetical protein [Coriobacteriales bacterium]
MGYSVALLYDERSPLALTRCSHVSQILSSYGHTSQTVPLNSTFAPDILKNSFDVCLLADTGCFSLTEDVQTLLESLNISYIGSPSETVRFTHDVREIHNVLNNLELARESTVLGLHGMYISASGFNGLGVCDSTEAISAQIPGGYPIVICPVKPYDSNRASLVHSDDEFKNALKEYAEEGIDTFVHASYEGIFVSVGAVEYDGDIDILPPLIQTVDQNDKSVSYTLAKASDLDPDPEEASLARSSLERAARELYDICGCRDYVLFNLLWDGARVRLVSVDCTPTLGADSPLLLACTQAGISFADLLDTYVSEYA